MDHIKTPRGNIYFKQKILFPGCHVIDRGIAFENLKLIDQVLSSLSIHWGVAFGTMLGIVRDDDFIEWDEDTDLYILEEEEIEFRNAMWKFFDVGFELIRYERAGLYSIRRKGEYVDFYVLRKTSEELRYTLDGCFVFEKYIKERKPINFKGIRIFIPKEVNDYFSLEYGNWQTPVRYYSPNVNLIRKTVLIAYSYFRLYSPTRIYIWWIKTLRSRDLARFIAKCKENGVRIDENISLKIKISNK